ncbi:hypothetical protein J5Y04_30140 [Kitasatospora sp. RG8]|uniref:hypothetical protein n=1 Tax=Kitasatospora sp. RG8 TaxID=2820815 RepID=UPI001AE0A312|nr:hypothetical protein [Kitasatospora sp. RG8]MBP0453772.1 hypothetical protein [Kitasatospora sp. RG8]
MRTVRGVAVLLAVGVVAATLATGDSRQDRPTAADVTASTPTPGPSDTPSGSPGTGPDGSPSAGPSPTWDGQVKVLGDGSTSYTGPQPRQPTPEKLKPGEKPPQFVVFSWDGALEGDDHLFSRFRKLGEENDARMTFFLSGIYTVPKSRRALYRPPQHDVGAASIDFATDAHIKDTLEQVRLAWQAGNEIGTHFNGHFCGDKGGGAWTTEEWKSELDQAVSFVTNWKTNTGFKDLPPLPFDYTKELVGGRAPCLEGQKALLPAEKAAGFRYDASSPGEFQVWPGKKEGIWNFPLQLLPYPGRSTQGLAMDFNFLAGQSGDSTKGDPKKYAAWEKETRDTYLAGFERVYNGSRAPLFIGNHFETWNGGIYMQAIEDVMKSICKRDGVRCVSFRQVADWLDAQDPKVLDKLRQLDPGQPADWARLVK